MAQQQRRFHWDKRKKQYVQLQPNEQVLAGKRVRTESGNHAKGEGKSSGLYRKWSKAHHTKILPVGLPEDEHAPNVKGLGDRWGASRDHPCVITLWAIIFCPRFTTVNNMQLVATLFAKPCTCARGCWVQMPGSYHSTTLYLQPIVHPLHIAQFDSLSLLSQVVSSLPVLLQIQERGSRVEESNETEKPGGRSCS